MLLSTKLYVDGGDPKETHEASELLKAAGLGGVHGQTTNPTLIAKNAAKEKGDGATVSAEEAIEYYKKTVQEIAKETDGPISIQVIGDPMTLTAGEMLSQARERITWISNAVIKFPCTKEGLAAAQEFCQEGPINITLTFTQEQAAAVYAATRHHTHDVYVSPFVGRLDDRGQEGMDVVANIIEMYRGLGDGHVRVLTASVRTLDHFLYAVFLKSDVITSPFGILKEWADSGYTMPPEEYVYEKRELEEIPYREITLDKEWEEYDLSHELTDAGLKRFWDDWSAIVSS